MNFTKTIAGIAITIAFIFLIVIFVTGIVLYTPKSPNLSGLNSSIGTNNSIGGLLLLDMKEISKHNNRNDCWLLINNKVYDVTSFIPMHPGGSQTIVPYCGTESTQQFDTKAGRGSHSSYAVSLLDLYYIGNLGQTIGTVELQNKTSAVQNASTGLVGGRGNGEGDD